MSEPETQYPPLPADDLSRTLRLAQQDNDGKLTHIGLVGDTYTILLSGEDTNEKFCVIDMHVPPGGGPVRIATTSKRHSSCSMATSYVGMSRCITGNAGSAWNSR